MAEDTAIDFRQASTAVKADVDVKDRKRQRSRIEFPYSDLDDALGVAKAIHQKGGVRCTMDQLASWMGHSSVDSGTFRSRLTAARMFGLVEKDRDTISLTQLGRNVVDPQKEAQAKVDAFLSVSLYRTVYNQYKGNLLPPDVGLEQTIVNLGVSERQKNRARQALQRSAKQSGFFNEGVDRLVMPSGCTATPESLKRGVDPAAQKIKPPDNRGGGGYDDGTGRTVILRSGGSVTLTYAANLFELSKDDREFLFALIDTLSNYENGTEKR